MKTNVRTTHTYSLDEVKDIFAKIHNVDPAKVYIRYIIGRQTASQYDGPGYSDDVVRVEVIVSD